MDNRALGKLLKKAGGDPKGLGSLKRLQALLETVAKGVKVPEVLSPLFILYDLRVAYSHLGSDQSTTEALETVTDRLGIDPASGLLEIYGCLTKSLIASYKQLVTIVEP